MEDTDTCLQCDDCGKKKPDVTETYCPFASEIHNKLDPATLCHDCIHNRAMEI